MLLILSYRKSFGGAESRVKPSESSLQKKSLFGVRGSSTQYAKMADKIKVF